MPKGPLSKKSRNIFTIANKYQGRIIFLTFLPSILMFLLFIGIVLIANPSISEALLHTSFKNMEKLIHHTPWLIFFAMSLILLVSMVAAFVISLNMVGSFGRILGELDKIIQDRSQKSITSREEDDLAKELLKRINVLIEHYVGK